MNIIQLSEACAKAILVVSGTSMKPSITLKMPENKHCPKRRRLFGLVGPLGNVVQFGFDGYDMVVFDPVEVMQFLANYNPQKESKSDD